MRPVEAWGLEKFHTNDDALIPPHRHTTAWLVPNESPGNSRHSYETYNILYFPMRHVEIKLLICLLLVVAFASNRSLYARNHSGFILCAKAVSRYFVCNRLDRTNIVQKATTNTVDLQS